MWKTVSLKTPALDASALNLPVSIETVTPWTAGARERAVGGSSWLGFPNAVAALATRLSDRPVPALLVLALAAGSHFDLAKQCESLASVLPLKQVKQWQRQATSMVSLEESKRQLVDAAKSTVGLQLNSLPTIRAQMQKTLSQQAKAAAAGMAGSDPLSQLSELQSLKNAFDEETDTPLPPMTGGDGWVFYAEENIIRELMTGHPGHNYSYTSMIAFIGTPTDLTYFREMFA